MQLVFIHADPKKSWMSKLTQFFTKSTAYHCGFVDLETSTFYDALPI